MAFSVGRGENGVNAAAAFVCGAEALRVSRHTLHYSRDKNQKNIFSISIFLDIFPLIKLRIDALVK